MAGTNRPKKRLGQPLNWTPDDLGQLSQITPADIKAAVALWNEESGKPVLLQAKSDEGDGENGQILS